MKEEEIKNLLTDILEINVLNDSAGDIEKVFEGDFLTRDVYFCLKDKDKDNFMIIVKKL